jgi:hypothetical protein
MKKVIRFFDVLEDKIRGHLSQYPHIYSLIGGVGVVLFWRGIWHTADEYAFMTGPVSLLLGGVILGLTGILVTAFIGNSIIVAGLKGEKKLEEKTRDEVMAEQGEIEDIHVTLQHIEKDLTEIKKELHKE